MLSFTGAHLTKRDVHQPCLPRRRGRNTNALGVIQARTDTVWVTRLGAFCSVIQIFLPYRKSLEFNDILTVKDGNRETKKKSWFDNLGGGPSSHGSVSPRIEFLIPKPLNRRMIVLVCGLSDFHQKLEFVRDLVQFNANTGMEIALLEGMVPM